MKFTLVEIETHFPVRFFLCIYIENLSIQKQKDMKKLQGNQHIFYSELISKPTVDIIGIKVSMWNEHKFETIFT